MGYLQSLKGFNQKTLTSFGSSDCNDSAPDINPSAPEICDGIDNDCNSIIDDGLDIDNDNDGYTTCEGDCDDNDEDINPSAGEICYDGYNNDCDGDIDCLDENCSEDTVCQECLPKGSLCTSDTECCSGYCRGIKCK